LRNIPHNHGKFGEKQGKDEEDEDGDRGEGEDRQGVVEWCCCRCAAAHLCAPACRLARSRFCRLQCLVRAHNSTSFVGFERCFFSFHWTVNEGLGKAFHAIR